MQRNETWVPAALKPSLSSATEKVVLLANHSPNEFAGFARFFARVSGNPVKMHMSFGRPFCGLTPVMFNGAIGRVAPAGARKEIIGENVAVLVVVSCTGS
jgi:hypothetical protein